MNPKKLFFIYPKFLLNGFFSPGRRLVHPAARLRLWHRTGSQFFKADSGRRFRHERGFIFSLQKPRQKWRKTATISVGKLARVYIYTLPICQFMDVAVYLPKTLHFRAFWPFFCYNCSDLIFSPKKAVFKPENHRISIFKYDHFFF